MAREESSSTVGVAGRTRWVLSLVLLVAASPRPVPAQVVINELLAENVFQNADEDGDSSDWVELYNAGTAVFDLTGFGLSDDERRPFRWIFPEVKLAPAEYLLVWCSGKDRFALAPEIVLAVDSPIPFLPGPIGADAAWRYLAAGPEQAGPPSGWQSPDFDDTPWNVGEAPFGFGGREYNTLLSDGIGAFFLRHEFVLERGWTLDEPILEVNFDDGFVAYLNGARVISARFGEDEEPTFASLAEGTNSPNRAQRFSLGAFRHLLRAGRNVLAVAVLNNSVRSTDMEFQARLGTVPPVYHTNFKLANDGDAVTLTRPDGDVADRVRFGPQTEDRSFGRRAGGAPDLVYYLQPSPLASNGGAWSLAPISSRPDLRPGGGAYAVAALEVEMSAQLPLEAYRIYYTTDGSAPAPASRSTRLYEAPILVEETTVLRAAAFNGDERVTRVETQSYFLAAERYDLPILSLAMDPTDFSTVHNNSGARGRVSERPGHVEILGTGGERAAAAGMGLRLHGGAGRNGALTIKKAYRMYFRGEYGDKKLEYPLIPDTDVATFDKLVLRANFNDAFRTGGSAAFIRDQLIRDLHADMGATVAHGSWYNLFVNGRYRGIYNVVERMDKDFFASYYTDDGENWDVIKTGNDVLDGDLREWNRLGQLISADPSRAENYQAIAGVVDIENYTGYMILNIWSQNHDWPHNNWYAARPRREDGRWMFLSWDAEFGIGLNPGGSRSDTFQHVLNRGGNRIADLLIGLIRNPAYQVYFLAQFERHVAGALSTENVLAHIGRLRDIVAADIPEEVRTGNGGSMTQWESNIRIMEGFAQQRTPAIRSFLLRSNAFRFPRVQYVTPARVSAPAEDTVLSLTGQGFTDQTEIFIGDLLALVVENTSATRLDVLLPFDMRIEGEPDITYADPRNGTFVSPGLLSVSFRRPNPRSLEPATGSNRGGDFVIIEGNRFDEGVRVEFGGMPAPAVQRLDDSAGRPDRLLRVVTPPGEGQVAVRVINVRPGDLPADKELVYTYVKTEARFRRGDANEDGVVDANDAVAIMAYQFGARASNCAASLDANGDGRVDLSDSVAVLRHLYGGVRLLPEPFLVCGREVTGDSLGCDEHRGCE